ncbi:hypothetical protein F2Q70_00039529 [Brassica cretica]|uniref:Uncharacterized protein n=1 Tax=Brassica cretica TaxID=69181 RepID=A0A8S9K9G3_BRACR|nr:hypothetical protein F2Q70_00039529 [Brassica cretica]
MVALPPPPGSPSHHHQGRPLAQSLCICVSSLCFCSMNLMLFCFSKYSWGGKVHGGWRRQGPWRLEDGSLVAAGGGKALGCSKRGKAMEEAAAVFFFFLLGLDFFRFRFGLVLPGLEKL